MLSPWSHRQRCPWWTWSPPRSRPPPAQRCRPRWNNFIGKILQCTITCRPQWIWNDLESVDYDAIPLSPQQHPLEVLLDGVCQRLELRTLRIAQTWFPFTHLWFCSRYNLADTFFCNLDINSPSWTFHWSRSPWRPPRSPPPPPPRWGRWSCRSWL